MSNFSQKTPTKRYSSASEYGTPGISDDGDDTDNSLYYSFAATDDESQPNKENSINGGKWTVCEPKTDSTRLSKAKTPLLRRVLQSNYTPQKKSSKRVTFSAFSQPSPKPAIEKSQGTEIVNPISNGTEETFQTINNDIEKTDEINADNGAQNVSISDTASDVADDLENELHNTIIENPSSASKLACSESETVILTDDQKLNIAAKSDPVETETELSTVLTEQKQPESVFEATTAQTKEVIKPKDSSSKSINASVINNTKTQRRSIKVKTTNSSLTEANKKLNTRNVAKINRQRLANENPKASSSVARKSTRVTLYTRQSFQKFEPRKSLGAVKQVVNKITKTVAAQPKATTSTANVVSSMATTNRGTASTTRNSVALQARKSMLPKRETIYSRKSIAPPNSLRKTFTIPGPTIGPKVPVVSSNVRSQRRETKVPVDQPQPSTSSSSTQTTSTAANPVRFIKPSAVPVRKPPISVSSAAKPNTIKCQYCDKCFIKSHGMKTHLLENCDKIPPAARRQLLKKEETSIEEVQCNSKQVSRRRTQAFDREIDFISKYSRLFKNVTNDSGTQTSATNDIETGLKTLRNELRKANSAHTGIARTPSKPIRCHICKKIFFDCVEYAEHSSYAHKID